VQGLREVIDKHIIYDGQINNGDQITIKHQTSVCSSDIEVIAAHVPGHIEFAHNMLGELTVHVTPKQTKVWMLAWIVFALALLWAADVHKEQLKRFTAVWPSAAS
tara:strand:+ start:155 stop:469 length:315 start_codon:yes stop_codon:yes gene_type:complete